MYVRLLIFALYSVCRELRRSAVKAWLGDDVDATNSSMELKLTSDDRTTLQAAGLNLGDITVYKYHNEYGYTYKSKQGHVLVHGRNEENNYGELLYIFKRRNESFVFLLLQDLHVEFVESLGLHVCTRACSTTVVKFENLISSYPINLYRGTNYKKEKINFFCKHEALIYD